MDANQITMELVMWDSLGLAGCERNVNRNHLGGAETLCVPAASTPSNDVALRRSRCASIFFGVARRWAFVESKIAARIYAASCGAMFLVDKPVLYRVISQIGVAGGLHFLEHPGPIGADGFDAEA